jgi:hypothetical protein
MEDLKSQFKEFVIPTAPSLLYERQYSPDSGKKKKSSSSKLNTLTINIAAFIERSKLTYHLTPVATATKRR